MYDLKIFSTVVSFEFVANKFAHPARSELVSRGRSLPGGAPNAAIGHTERPLLGDPQRPRRPLEHLALTPP